MAATPQYATPEQEGKWRKKIAVQNRLLLWCVFALLMLYPLGKVYAASQRENVLEAVVRGLGIQQMSPVIFLTIDDADPNNAFLQRFKNGSPLVREASQAVNQTPPHMRPLEPMGALLFDPITRERGSRVYLNSDATKFYGPFYARVEVGFPGGGRSYSLVRTLRGWVVNGSEMTWIS